MSEAIEMTIIIVMLGAIVVLLLEAIGNRVMRATFLEKPHIRLFTLGVLILGSTIILLTLIDRARYASAPLTSLELIASLFLLANTIIALFLARKTIADNQDGEIYFLLLASLALAMSNVSTHNLLLNMVCSTGFMVTLATLSIRTAPQEFQAEIGMKLSFQLIALMLLFFAAIVFLGDSFGQSDFFKTQHFTVVHNHIHYLGIMMISLAALALAGVPPFHFAQVDNADGGNISIAFLFTTNAGIQGAVLLLKVHKIISNSQFESQLPTNYLGFILIIGFSILWIRALDQNKIRRTVAYIAQSLTPLFCMSLLFGYSALLPRFVFIIALFLYSTVALFTLYGSLAYMNPINLPHKTWEDLSGFGRIRPWHSLTFLVALATIAGIPGTLGYFIKLSLIAPLNDNFIFVAALFLSIAIGAACMMRMFVFMFSKTTQTVIDEPNDLRSRFTLLVSSAILIALGFFPFVH